MKTIAALISLLIVLAGCASVLDSSALLEIERMRQDNERLHDAVVAKQYESCGGLNASAQAACVTATALTAQAESLTKDKTTAYTYAAQADKTRSEAMLGTVKTVAGAAVSIVGIGVGAWALGKIADRPVQTVDQPYVVRPEIVHPDVIQIPQAVTP